MQGYPDKNSPVEANGRSKLKNHAIGFPDFFKVI